MELIHQALAGPTVARPEHHNPTASVYQLAISYPGPAPGTYMTSTPPGSVPENWVMAPDFQSWVQLPPPQYQPVLETHYAEACHDYCPVFTLCSTTGETKPLPPPADLNSRMVMALAQAAGKTDMQATFNHLITSFWILVQGVSDGCILRVLVDTANARIVEIIKRRTCFDCC